MLTAELSLKDLERKGKVRRGQPKHSIARGAGRHKRETNRDFRTLLWRGSAAVRQLSQPAIRIVILYGEFAGWQESV